MLKLWRKHDWVMYVLVGFLGVGYYLNYWWAKQQLIALEKTLKIANQLTEIPESQSLLPVPVHIYIQWFVDVEVNSGDLVDNQWTINESSATYLSQSAKPGTGGNVVIYGHNTKKILGNIRALKGNEIIAVTLSDGQILKYRIKNLRQIKSIDTEVIKPSKSEQLTLYTCAGFADMERFVVVAEPVMK